MLMSPSSPTLPIMPRSLRLSAKTIGQTTYAFRQRLAAKAYARTAAYDAAISNWFAEALEIDMPAYRVVGGGPEGEDALRREPAPERWLLRDRR